MNDTNVRNVTFWKYGDPGNLDSQYVQAIVFKYPKVSVDRFKSKLLNLSKESFQQNFMYRSLGQNNHNKIHHL